MNFCKPPAQPVRCAGCWHYFTPHGDPKATLILRYFKAKAKNGKRIFLETEVEICPTCAAAAERDPHTSESIQQNVLDAYANTLQGLFAANIRRLGGVSK